MAYCIIVFLMPYYTMTSRLKQYWIIFTRFSFNFNYIPMHLLFYDILYSYFHGLFYKDFYDTTFLAR